MSNVSLTRFVMIILGVIIVLMIVLAMQGNIGGEWTTVGQGFANLVFALAVFGVAMVSLVAYMRR